MMNREKEIKDICKLMCATCAQFDGCAINCKAHRDAAEALYSVGYRKIYENCVVITKDELKLYKMQAVKEFAERLKELLHNDYIKPSGFTDERCVFECIDELLR